MGHPAVDVCEVINRLDVFSPIDPRMHCHDLAEIQIVYFGLIYILFISSKTPYS
jgi:hypothetical protein